MTSILVDLEHARAFAANHVDVATLNARVSDAMLQQIERIRAAGALAPSASLLVLGPAGAGKTHLFERLRRRVGPGATFVHLRPEIGIESSLRHVLLTVIEALKQSVADRDYTQLDVVVGSALAIVDGDNPRFPSAFLDKARAMSPADRDDLVQRAIDRFEREDPRIDTGWLELFLGVPFLRSAERRAALAWLAGREPSELELGRIGRTEPLATTAVKASLRALATVAAQAAPLVVVFDQLENLVESDGRVDRIHAHARVLAELFDEVSRVVLVQLALDGEWVGRIRPELASAERSRLEANVLHVDLPTPDEREELLRRWLDRLPADQRPGVFPAPFREDDWLHVRTAPGATPRMLFVAARKALAGEDPFPAARPESGAAVAPTEPEADDVDDVLARHWDEALNEVRAELERASAEKRGADESRVAAAMRILLLREPGVEVAITSARGGHETLRFVRDGTETHVFVVQSTNGRSVAATLGHALTRSETSRTIVVREQALALPTTWKAANTALERLRGAPKVLVLDVAWAEIVRALALHDFFADARSQDLPGPDGSPIAESVVRAWADRILVPREFALALALVAAASPESESIDETRSTPLVETEATAPLAPVAIAVKNGAPSKHDPSSATNDVIRRLRLASIERIVAEVQHLVPRTTRARVLVELRAIPGIRLHGRTIAHLPSEPA